MTHDDHAALIEVKNLLAELHVRRHKARAAADWQRYRAVQAQIYSAEADRIELLRRTEPEDEPRL